MPKIVFVLILVVFINISLTSCFDASEVSHLAYVVAIGVDKGIADKWRVTFKFPSQVSSEAGQASSGGGGGGGGSTFQYKSITLDAPSFYAAVNLANTSVPRKLNFMHTRVIIISEELAESGDFGEIIAPLTRYREIRRTINIVVSKGSAQNFVENIKPYLGPIVVKDLTDLLDDWHDIGFYPNMNLYTLYNGIKSISRQPVIIYGAVNNDENFPETGKRYQGGVNIAGNIYAGDTPKKGGNSIEFMGTAILDGDRMVGRLTGHETRLMLIAKGEFQRAVMTVKDPLRPEWVVPLGLKLSSRPDVRVRFVDQVPHITLSIKLEGEIMAIQSRVDYESAELRPILEKTFETEIKNDLDALINKCKGLGTDIFNFGHTAVRQFGTIEEWEDYNWLSRFKDVQVTTDVKLIIRRTGTLISDSPIRTTKGSE